MRVVMTVSSRYDRGQGDLGDDADGGPHHASVLLNQASLFDFPLKCGYDGKYSRADFDGRNFATGGGVVAAITRKPEVLLSGFRDGHREGCVFGHEIFSVTPNLLSA